MTDGQSKSFIEKGRCRRAMEKLRAAAREGLRCPTNDEFGFGCMGILPKLARMGLIRIEIHAKNWRTVTIMDGPDRGKSTMPAPNGWEVYRIIDKSGSKWPTRDVAL